MMRKIKRNILRNAVGNRNLKKEWNSYRNSLNKIWITKEVFLNIG